MVEIWTVDELANLALSEGMPDRVVSELWQVDIAASEGQALTIKRGSYKLRWIVTDGRRFYVCSPRIADSLVAHLGGYGFRHHGF